MADGDKRAEARKKRTITEIRDSKQSGEKMVYMSVPDYTSARWAEMAGVDVAVVGDSLAMVAHGHSSTIPATMDMMVMHSLAVRRGAPATFVLGFRSTLGKVRLERDWQAPAPTITVPALAAHALVHRDAHLAKYTAACLRAAADDPPARDLFLAAAAFLGAWWDARPDYKGF